MESIVRELRQAWRGLSASRGFTALVVAVLALGVGTTTAVFSVIRGVLLEPLPYREPERLALVWSALEASGYDRAPISGPELRDLRERSAALSELAAVWSTSASLVEGGEPESLQIGLVTANFLSLLGVAPVAGRGFQPEEEGIGAAPAIVLSGALWERRFGGDPAVLGRALRIDGGWGFEGGSHTVVGVMPADFRLLLPADAGVPAAVDAWIPFPFDLAEGRRGVYYLRTLARLAPSATLGEARAEVEAIGRRIAGEHAEYAASGRSFTVVGLHDDGVRAIRPVLLALLASAGLLLLIACADVAGLLLAHASERRREIAIRLALGASPGRIAGQLLAESALLSALGAAVGVALARGLVTGLLALQPWSAARLGSVSLDLQALGFAVALSLACGLVFGLAPLGTALRVDLEGSLAGAGRGADAPRLRARRLLVTGQVALGVVLTVGAGLALVTFERLLRVDPGFAAESVLAFRLSLPAERYATQERIAGFSRELERRLSGLPGVDAAGAINQLPLDDLPNWSTSYRLRGEADAGEGAGHEADARVVTPGYFRAIGVRLLAGRSFEERDDASGRPVVIVDETLARAAWPGQDALGREIEVSVWQGASFAPAWAEVVGVVRHVRHHDLAREVREQVFVPFAQGARNQMGVAVRAAGDPARLREAIAGQLAEIDADLALAGFRPLARDVERALAPQRFTLVLATAFAAAALLLAGVGLHGALSYSVSRRAREIGLRMALGARTRQVVGLVAGEVAALVAVGVAAGLLAARSLAGLARGLLYGVAPSEPAVFAAAAALVGLLAVAAAALPSRRAALIDPARSMRGD